MLETDQPGKCNYVLIQYNFDFCIVPLYDFILQKIRLLVLL